LTGQTPRRRATTQDVTASRGTNQTGVRLYNERLVLSLIRRHGEVPKADLARMTGLSPQTVSIITNALEADGLLSRGAPQRGKVGQPLVPYSLRPEGAFSLGLKLGRRSADLYLINFTGEIIELVHETYAYPTPEGIRRFTRLGIEKLLAKLPHRLQKRITGLGIAAPFEIWTWHEEIGAPREAIDAWRDVDVRRLVAEFCPWPVYFSNDITAACAAELMFGSGADFPDYLYVYVGSFVGGGLVLDGHLFPGRSQNAAALGSMPSYRGRSDGLEPLPQLVNYASIYVLERKLVAAGLPSEFLWQSPDDWGDAAGPLLSEWIGEAAESLAQAIIAAVAVVDVQNVLIDGAFPISVRQELIDATRAVLDRSNLRGLTPFRLVAGTIGAAARAMGGAALPLLANFTQDREVLFKDRPDEAGDGGELRRSR
jgi:predicted NBD/HSP70 family sugar kinase